MEVDNNDIILDVNNAFIQMSGFSSKELIGSVAIDTLLGGSKKDIMIEKIKTRKEGKKDLWGKHVVSSSDPIHSVCKHYVLSEKENQRWG